MTQANRTNAVGWIGFGLLLLAWGFPYSTNWISEGATSPTGEPVRKLLLFAAGAVTASVSLVLALACARMRSRWWYLLAAASLVSAFVLWANFLVGN